jgi:transposase
MSTIPTSVTEEQFETYIYPCLRTAQRGYKCKIPLYKVFNYMLKRLYTGCQWAELVIDVVAHDPEKKEISWQAVYYHFHKWSHDGSFERLWHHSIQRILKTLDLTYLNWDGSHSPAKKGGESVVYQYRKRTKTSNILPITDAQGRIVACTPIVAGNHHDAFHLKVHLQTAFKTMKRLGLCLTDTYFNADSAFDTRDARKTCFNHGLIPNMDHNERNQKTPKRGRKRLFNAAIYKKRFSSERTFAWIDKFRGLLTRFERKDALFLGGHHIAFTLINLRHLFASKV